MSRPPNERASNNPWPEWPTIFRTDYGHDEYQKKAGSDPRIFAISTKALIFIFKYKLQFII